MSGLEYCKLIRPRYWSVALLRSIHPPGLIETRDQGDGLLARHKVEFPKKLSAECEEASRVFLLAG